MSKKRVVVLTGAGISAESGLRTFRDSDGLWEGHRVEDVATPQAWRRNSDLVLQFYNERRRSVLAAEPNAAHHALKKLEEKYQVDIITQNVDDLHERAGSSRVLHLHGEIRKSQSTGDPELVYDIDGTELTAGELCAKGFQLRPFIVWFGEAVPMMDAAAATTARADVVLVVGTSLVVYPAAGLVNFAPRHAPCTLIDPKADEIAVGSGVRLVAKRATEGVPEIVEELLDAL